MRIAEDNVSVATALTRVGRIAISALQALLLTGVCGVALGTPAPSTETVISYDLLSAVGLPLSYQNIKHGPTSPGPNPPIRHRLTPPGAMLLAAAAAQAHRFPRLPILATSGRLHPVVRHRQTWSGNTTTVAKQISSIT